MIKYDGKMKLREGDVVLLKAVVKYDVGRDTVGLQYVPQYPDRSEIVYIAQPVFEIGDLVCNHKSAKFKILALFQDSDGVSYATLESTNFSMTRGICHKPLAALTPCRGEHPESPLAETPAPSDNASI